MPTKSKGEHPVTTCGACGQADDHPKHQIHVAFNNPDTGGALFHEHDFDRDGNVYYHFDCPSDWHGRFHPEFHARLSALASSGVQGDALRSRIQAGEV